MGYAVRFAAYTPPARDDDEPWTHALIEEAGGFDGPWTTVETIPLTPVDPDPASPAQRSFTTDLATLAAGYYRVTWIDASGDTAPTRPVFNGQNIAPSLSDVALLLPTRLKDDAGGVAAFTDNTTPTRAQVEGYIGKGIRRVRMKAGAIPEEIAGDARDAVATYAAALAERSLWPEQQNPDASPYEALLTDFDAMLTDLEAATAEVGEGGEVGPGDDRPLALGTFPAPGVHWDSEPL